MSVHNEDTIHVPRGTTVPAGIRLGQNRPALGSEELQSVSHWGVVASAGPAFQPQQLRDRPSPVARLIARLKGGQVRADLASGLRDQGHIVLTEEAAPGGFDAIVLYGRTQAGVVDLRGRAPAEALARLRSRRGALVGSGVDRVLVVHEDSEFVPSVLDEHPDVICLELGGGPELDRPTGPRA